MPSFIFTALPATRDAPCVCRARLRGGCCLQRLRPAFTVRGGVHVWEVCSPRRREMTNFNVKVSRADGRSRVKLTAPPPIPASPGRLCHRWRPTRARAMGSEPSWLQCQMVAYYPSWLPGLALGFVVSPLLIGGMALGRMGAVACSNSVRLSTVRG